MADWNTKLTYVAESRELDIRIEYTVGGIATISRLSTGDYVTSWPIGIHLSYMPTREQFNEYISAQDWPAIIDAWGGGTLAGVLNKRWKERHA